MVAFFVLYIFLSGSYNISRNQKSPDAVPDYESNKKNLSIPLEHIQFIDPSFSMDAFTGYLTNLTNTVLDSYEKRDYESLSGVFNKKMLLVQSAIIRGYIEKELYPNYLDRDFSSFSVTLFKIEGDLECLSAYFEISLLEFILDGNGQVVCGDNKTRRIIQCNVSLQRPRGSKTPETKSGYCPKCGALLENLAGKCPYCGYVTISHDLSWELVLISFDGSETWGYI